MGYNQAYNAYKNTNIRTASQGHLVVLLYEEAVRRLAEASGLFGQDGTVRAPDIEKFNSCLQKAQAVITELQVSLNMEKGGEIAQNLMSLYVYFNNELMAANINHDRKKIDFVLDMMRQLTDSWRQAANSTANAPSATVSNVLNIEG
ncbi:MAG TPA: flagellar export chaperone FliS [Treponema sp.]|nr:flagellar export chaperone FliS [Treponema sp.]